MSILTCLTSGGVISVRNSIIQQVNAQTADITNVHKQNNLKFGLGIQYEHTLRLQQAGYPVVLFEDIYPGDRQINGILQDDKLALLKNGGGWASSHTLSNNEVFTWKKHLVQGSDVIIHSFEQVHGRNPWDFMYCGVYYFSDVLPHLSFSKNKNTAGTMYFYRDAVHLHLLGV